MGYNNIPDSVKAYLPGEFQTNESFTPSKTNFLTNNKFIFVLNRCPTLTYFCQRVTIPSVSYGVAIQNNPMAVQIQRPGTSINLEELQISFAVDEELKNWLEIFNWGKAVYAYDKVYESLRENQKTSDAMVIILNSSYRPFLRVKFYDIFPTFLSSLDFDTTLPDTDNIIASVNFAYNYFDFETID